MPQDSEFLALSSNTETIHIFKLDQVLLVMVVKLLVFVVLLVLVLLLVMVMFM